MKYYLHGFLLALVTSSLLSKSGHGQSTNSTTQTPQPPRSSGDNASRCEEIRRVQAYDAISVMNSEGLVSTREDVSFRSTLFSSLIIGTSSVLVGCAPQQDATNCSRDMCYHLRYRSMDGSCNNFDRPFFGAAAIPFIRHNQPAYDDGIGAILGSSRRPSARDITRNVLSSGQHDLHDRYNSLLMQFGQFMAHDISKTAMLPRDRCDRCVEIPGRCAPIPLLVVDPAYACPRLPCCLLFTRAAPVCGTGVRTARWQLNENTAFLDASAVYGSSIPDMIRLREGPFLKTTFFNGSSYLPFDLKQCPNFENCDASFDAGDSRFVIFIGLAAFHTLMLREHNRIAGRLIRLNPKWDADRVFQEARKIVGAEMQIITFKEWLPKILGNVYQERLSVYGGYRSDVNPSISTEFAHAAMRFGHGMILDFYNRTDSNGQTLPEGGLKFEEGTLRPQKLLFNGGIEALLRGMLNVPVKKPQRIAPQVTTRLFGSSDLASTSLQRGRDAGIGSYNDMREFCGLPRAHTFDDLKDEIPDDAMRDNLRQGFTNPDNIDLYVGVLIETPVPGGMVGPTGACIIANQFKRLRDADRFWYENDGIFSRKQLVQLDRVSMARILCDNMNDFHRVPTDAFELPDETNLNTVPCDEIPSIDFSQWSD